MPKWIFGSRLTLMQPNARGIRQISIAQYVAGVLLWASIRIAYGRLSAFMVHATVIMLFVFAGILLRALAGLWPSEQQGQCGICPSLSFCRHVAMAVSKVFSCSTALRIRRAFSRRGKLQGNPQHPAQTPHSAVFFVFLLFNVHFVSAITVHAKLVD